MPKPYSPFFVFHPLLRIAILLAGIVGLAESCRKVDRVASAPQMLSETEAKFFNNHRSADVTEKTLVDFFKRRNDSSHFVEKAVERIGYPRWDKALRLPISNTIQARTENNDSSVAVTYIPFARDEENYVNAVMLVKITATDTSFSYLCDWQYRELLSSTVADTSFAALKYFLFFAGHDNRVFGHTRFQLKDNRLLQSVSDTLANASKQYMLELVEANENQVELLVAPDPELPHSSCLMIYDMIKTGYVVNYYKVGKICVLESYYLPGSSGGGGGAGGNGGGNPPPDDTPPTCHDGPVEAGKPMDPCGPGWEPLPVDDQPFIPFFGIDSIINDFTNPCIIAAKNKLPDINLNIFTNSLYFAQLSQTLKWKIVFKENRELIYQPTGEFIPAESFPDTIKKEWIIILNPLFWEQATQPNATQEIAGINIIHEIVHGFIYLYKDFFELTRLNNFTTHEVMFRTCVNAMADLLQNSFSISATDAKALALQGLDDILQKEYNTAGNLSAYNTAYNQFALSNYGLSIPQTDAVYDQFIAGTKGTKCF